MCRPVQRTAWMCRPGLVKRGRELEAATVPKQQHAETCQNLAQTNLQNKQPKLQKPQNHPSLILLLQAYINARQLGTFIRNCRISGMSMDQSEGRELCINWYPRRNRGIMH
ncbi:hypothetical protein M9H77_14595 [Catharanthus roseus]|uniref:Uncharacterized protein n=1 Tax=Catharanthus roseus TaxID=4058 RepID=A0ACC0BNT0_CATRO|nr:hypothetical protein M9H77_14595 [Catharanthus roseus]